MSEAGICLYSGGKHIGLVRRKKGANLLPSRLMLKGVGGSVNIFLLYLEPDCSIGEV